MKEITRHYLVCALWSSTDDDEQHLDKNYNIEDFAPEALEQAEADCTKFLSDHMSLITASDMTISQVGHDFWLTRNGHGAGFWDRGLGEVGDVLTKACEEYGELYPYLGDDGKLYFA